jgi:hypothetical protein
MTPRAAALAALERALAEEPKIDETRATPDTARRLADRYIGPGHDGYPEMHAQLASERLVWSHGIPIEPLVGTVLRNAALSLKGSK